MTPDLDLAVSLGTGQRLFMPVIVALAIVFLALVLRWAQTPNRARRRRLTTRRGLLMPVALVPHQVPAEQMIARLARYGIRATASRTSHGVEVLVWREQYGEARLRLRDSDPGEAGPGDDSPGR